MSIQKKILSLLFSFTILFVAVGCATTTYYDAQADQLLTAYAQKSNSQFVKLEHDFEETQKVPAYDQSFYDSLQADMDVIQVRMLAVQQGQQATDLLMKQFEGLGNLIGDIKKSHKKAIEYSKSNGVESKSPSPSFSDGSFTPVNFKVVKDSMNSYLRTLIAHEAALKNSQNSSTSK